MTLAAGPLHRADLLILVGYFTLMLGIGIYFSRRMRVMKDYFSGGNRIPWWLSGVSFYMSSFSVATFVSYSALAYAYGQVAITLYWLTVPATLASVILFSKRWRRARINSPVEYLETRYSATVRQLFAWQGIVVRLIDSALKLIAIGIFVHKTVGLGMKPSMLGAGLIMLVYTLLGGLWAVTVTDFVQFIILAAAVSVLLPLSLREVGGLGPLIRDLPDSYLHLTHVQYNGIYLVSTLLLLSLAYSGVQWSLIQRYYCVPNERDAYKVGGLVVLLNIITPPLMFLPAVAASRFLPGLEQTDQVYPLLCAHLLPPGMFGLVIAAMFSATMSMLSSDYNVSASVLTNDVYRRLIRPAASQGELVWIGRLMTAAIGSGALALAWAMSDYSRGEHLFRNMIKLFSVATAPLAIPMLAGLLSPRVTHRAALAGLLVGVTAGLAALLVCPNHIEYNAGTWSAGGGQPNAAAAADGAAGQRATDGGAARALPEGRRAIEPRRAGRWVIKKENIVFLVALLATLATILAAVRIDRSSAEEQARVEAFLRRLQVPIGALEEDRASPSSASSSPFAVVGISIALIGGMMLAVLPAVTDRLAQAMDLGIGLALATLGAAMVAGSRITKRREERAS